MRKSGEIIEIVPAKDHDDMDKIVIVDDDDYEYILIVDLFDLEEKIAKSTFGKWYDDPVGCPVIFDPDEETIEVEEPE